VEQIFNTNQKDEKTTGTKKHKPIEKGVIHATQKIHPVRFDKVETKLFNRDKSGKVETKLLTGLLLSAVFLFGPGLTGLQAQESMNATGGDASGSGGTFSYSFGQFASQSFFEGNSSVAQGVQHPFEFFETEQTVPDTYTLANATLTDGEMLCYNALENITVAGSEGPVEIQPNATVEFIAGQSIRFLPGFHAQAGSSVTGRITTTGDFCDGYAVPGEQVPQVTEKSVELVSLVDDPAGFQPDMSVKVFPNPNNGRFRVELINFDNKALVYVYNQLGAILYQAEIDNYGHNEIDLPNAHSGLYYVRVVEGEKQFVNKIIVN